MKLPSSAFKGIFISTCNVDVRWFPFDIQRCELKFGSWTFDGWLLDIQMKEADVSGYMPNGEWDLLGETGCEALNNSMCCFTTDAIGLTRCNNTGVGFEMFI